MCVSVSCPECFLGPERAFWPAEERMPLRVGGGCPDDKPEDQMLLVSWVEGGPEGGCLALKGSVKLWTGSPLGGGMISSEVLK